MGRRKNKRHFRQKCSAGDSSEVPGKRKPYNEIIKKNEKFEQFYKLQGLIPPEEWDLFMETLRTNLPTSFRITGYKGQAKAMLNIIKGKYFDDLLKQKSGICQPLCLPWYPNNLAWQLNLSRVIIRTSEELQHLHNFLVSETETGNISRQETVSMIPPILLDIQPHHKVLDMCAAPGSKTAQVIEFLHKEYDEGKIPDGLVVANDVDNKRCYMLVHQAKRLNSPCFIITNHDASSMPSLKVLKEGQLVNLKYDRILCDVPCSGDGTMRKIPDIWQKWNPANANSLHSLQLRIAKRGLELLAQHGRLVYSTCSLNPIEDEAVISNLLKMAGDSIELLDVNTSLPGLKTCPGVSQWKVVSKSMEVFEKCEDVPQKYHTLLRPTMFPTNPEMVQGFHLERCLRILPHHQDTGGFFVAVIKKLKEKLPWEKDFVSSNAESVSEPSRSPPRKKQRLYGYKEDPFIFLEENDDDWPVIRDFYNLKDFNHTQLLCRCQESRKRNLYFVSDATKNIIQNNLNRIKIINTGVRMFCRSENKEGKCLFRLTQEGVSAVLPFLGSRKIQILREDLILLLTNEFTSNDKFSQDTQRHLTEIESGCVLLIYTGKSGSDEFSIEVSCWKGKLTLRCYVPKTERAHYLRIIGVDVTNYEKREKKKFKIKDENIVKNSEEPKSEDSAEISGEVEDKHSVNGTEDSLKMDEVNAEDGGSVKEKAEIENKNLLGTES